MTECTELVELLQCSSRTAQASCAKVKKPVSIQERRGEPQQNNSTSRVAIKTPSTWVRRRWRRRDVFSEKRRLPARCYDLKHMNTPKFGEQVSSWEDVTTEEAELREKS
ncbi:hypothetical protein INR49_028470 [Caranx melampygus]|nr:hypothetical protein INR49_028470 [Caranx melampygus]